MSAPARAALVLLVAAGCAGAPAPRGDGGAPDVDASVARLAAKLVRGAELRTDPGTMRVYVHAVIDPRVAVLGGRPHHTERVAQSVEEELVLALSAEWNLLDAALFDDSPYAPENVRARAEALGATHVVLVEIEPREPGLIVTAKLVDARSFLILATARGFVDADDLTAPVVAKPRTSFPAVATAAGTTTPTLPTAPLGGATHSSGAAAGAAAEEPLAGQPAGTTAAERPSQAPWLDPLANEPPLTAPARSGPARGVDPPPNAPVASYRPLPAPPLEADRLDSDDPSPEALFRMLEDLYGPGNRPAPAAEDAPVGQGPGAVRTAARRRDP